MRSRDPPPPANDVGHGEDMSVRKLCVNFETLPLWGWDVFVLGHFYLMDIFVLSGRICPAAKDALFWVEKGGILMGVEGGEK